MSNQREGHIDELRRTVATLEASLKTALEKIASLEKRADQTDAALKEVEPILKRVVKYDDEIKIFSAHPLDPLRCIAFPGDISIIKNCPSGEPTVAQDPYRAIWKIKHK